MRRSSAATAGAIAALWLGCVPSPVTTATSSTGGGGAPSCTGTGITFETRQFAPGSALATNSADAVSIFEGLPPGGNGYGVNDTLTSTESYSNHTSIPGGTMENIAYHLEVSFLVDASDTGSFGFRLGMDYGLGGTLLVDGHELASHWRGPGPPTVEDDQYWGGSWVSPVGVLQGAVTLAAGAHTVETYGFENGFDCTNGFGHQGALMELEVLAPGADPGAAWAPISATTLHLCGQ